MDDEKARIVMEAFDRDRSGALNYDEFLRAIRVS
jgi:hypothetical protein